MSSHGHEVVPADGGDELGVSLRAGFANAYRDHHDVVTAVAQRICGFDHAVDVTQDVFVTLWSFPERFDPNRGSLRSYLVVLAHHKAVDVLRSQTARLAREQRVDAGTMPPPATVEDRLLRHEVATRVRSAVAGLPVDEREAIISAFYEHRSYRATAQWLDVPEGTIKYRIRRGLQRLQPALSELSGDATAVAETLPAADAVGLDAPVVRGRGRRDAAAVTARANRGRLDVGRAAGREA